jgi:tRNA(fMet)-specific endonuclease VapC
MLVLDTDVLTLIQRREGAAYSRLDTRLQAAAASRAICVTIISLEEQTRGWLTFISRARSLDRQIEAYRRLHELFDDYRARRVLDFDERAARQYQQLVKARVRIGSMDLKIAAVALVHGATLLSRNQGDFRKVPGLQVEDWTLLPSAE